MKIATLTIDRGDRPKMIQQCKRLIKRQTRKPDLEIYVIEPSTSNLIDIVPRFRSGWLEAKKNNIDVIVVIESDDWYNHHYIDTISSYFEENNIDVIGWETSLYYNVCNKTYQEHNHPNRASLYTTAFKVSALDDFRWPKDDYKFLDIPLWRHFKSKLLREIEYGFGYDTIGIKHNEGIRAGIGHKSIMRNKDPDFDFLKLNFVKPYIGEDVKFYKTFCNG